VSGRSGGRAWARTQTPENEPHDERHLLAALSLEDKVHLLTGADNWHTRGHPAIGLRPMTWSDGPAGVRGAALDERNPSASLLCPSALGATWDPALIADVARALGTEARSKGIDVLLGPTINIMRTPLGGRGFECFSEDPELTARLAVAFVCGLQQAGIASAVKHYVGNDSETERWTYDVKIAAHVLRELYLVPFEACVREADVGVVMTGYNSVNGFTMTEHGLLLSSILKHEWGFAGVALSDWHATRSTVPTAVAGLDLAMPGPHGPWGDKLAAAIQSGEVTEAEIDAKVLRILRLARRVGALGPSPDGPSPDGPSPDGPSPDGPSPDGLSPDNKAPAPVLADPQLLRKAAAASFTLLRNDGTLPLDPARLRRVAIIGPNAVYPVTQGGGSATVIAVSASLPVDALTAALSGPAAVTVAPGCVTWSNVPQPPAAALTDPVSGEPGTRVEFRAADGTLLRGEHRSLTMFTWWEGLPDGVGWGGSGTISLRARYRAMHTGPHVIGGGGAGHITLTVDGTVTAEGVTKIPADPVEVMLRPDEVRAVVGLHEGQEADIEVRLLPEQWQGPVAIRLGIVPEPDEEAMLGEAVRAAREADAAIVVVGSSPATESEGFDRPGLGLPGRQDELVRRIAAANEHTVVVVNAGMPMLLPWAEEVAAVGYAWLPGQVMGEALADVLLGRAEPSGRLPVTIPRAEADCPVLHAAPRDGELSYGEGLLIGYRGYDRVGTMPHFAFGHGLGYTTWAYESVSAEAVLPPDGDPAVTVVVRNTGSRAGREVVQAYLEPPSVTDGRPIRVLAAFGSATAGPGETAEVRLTVPRRAFARYDDVIGAWVWPRGDYTIRAGRSSRDLPLAATIRS